MSIRWMLMLGLVLGVALVGCPGDDDDDDDATAANDDATPGDDDDDTAAADFNAPGYCAAPPVGTARDIVYHVRGPSGTQAIEICVETAAGGDPRIAVLEDPSCGQPANRCVDDQPAGVSEFLHADRGPVFYSDDTYVVISEMVHSGADFTVSFQALN